MRILFGMDFTCEFRPEKMTNLINIKKQVGYSLFKNDIL
ncbi:Uncharacterised protein [Escherichia coli]|uniref:Uncharacterized protein n=1 Tax=Escherichia coli TaxID=562 RepID=A0A376J912_ECOLX|nr:Uncharacterised protein [Escherichia coli]